MEGTSTPGAPMADLAFHFDPVCPFCWMTSRWVRQVQSLRGLDVEWRFVSLALLNDEDAEVYEGQSEHYRATHVRGLELLRVCAAAREEHGSEVVGPLYRAMGDAVWEQPGPAGPEFDDVLRHVSRGRDVEAIVTSAGLPVELAAAVGDRSYDPVIRDETETALAAAGGDVGTPILHFSPPGGPAFFGPVISEQPTDEDAVRLWEAVETLAHFPSFAELKRALRDAPDVPLLREVRDAA